MTRDEHLYTIAGEEGVEIAQRCSKAVRFGGDEVQPGQDLNNRQRILQEFADLVGTLELLGLDVGIPVYSALRPWIDAKKAKVERFLDYSRECGTLSDVPASRPTEAQESAEVLLFDVEVAVSAVKRWALRPGNSMMISPDAHGEWVKRLDVLMALEAIAPPTEAQRPAPGPTQVVGHCGSCGGTDFVVVERCTECGEEEQVERLKGTASSESRGSAGGVMKLVVIESPLNAPTREGIEKNKEYAKRAMLDSLRRGEAPYASHLLFDQPGLLDDLNKEERKLGMRAGFAWGKRCDLVAVYADLGISDGMRRGIERALEHGQKVTYRYLERRDVD